MGMIEMNRNIQIRLVCQISNIIEKQNQQNTYFRCHFTQLAAQFISMFRLKPERPVWNIHPLHRYFACQFRHKIKKQKEKYIESEHQEQMRVFPDPAIWIPASTKMVGHACRQPRPEPKMIENARPENNNKNFPYMHI